MPRLFAGLELPPATRARLAALSRPIPGARWLAEENLHLTLRFFGELSIEMARDVDAALMTVDMAGFEIEIKSVGHFGNARRGGILWAGVGPNQALSRLAKTIDRTIDRMADVERRDKPFQPHVTLARLKFPDAADLAAFLAAESSFMLPPIGVSKFALFSSMLSPAGAQYRVEADYPLAPPGTSG